MATRYHGSGGGVSVAPVSGSLHDPARAIIGPRADALLLWGAPLAAFLSVQAWLRGWDRLASSAAMQPAVIGLFAAVAVLTWAHLIAVVPRAYLNREVFVAYRWRLTLVPATLLAALLLSPTALICGAVLAVFWDVHHSAMQNFGFARLYDMRAGNPPALLRAADLRLNWAMYVGPLAASAALATHLDHLGRFDGTMLSALTAVPGVLAAHQSGIRVLALLAYTGVLAWTVADYAAAIRSGYRLPAHKLAAMAVTGAVSILAWGFSPPLVALALATRFGLWSVGAYLLSGAICTLAALAINRDWARPQS